VRRRNIVDVMSRSVAMASSSHLILLVIVIAICSQPSPAALAGTKRFRGLRDTCFTGTRCNWGKLGPGAVQRGDRVAAPSKHSAPVAPNEVYDKA